MTSKNPDHTLHQLTVPQDQANQRLDGWLTEQLPDLSRSKIQSLIKQELVLLEGAPVRANLRILAGATFTLSIPPPTDTTPKPEKMELNILHEDDDIIIIQKPISLVVHPAPGHYSGTLVNGLLHHCPALQNVGEDPIRPGIVHRLDRDTTGIILIAKSELALWRLGKQFELRKIHKTYNAIGFNLGEKQDLTNNGKSFEIAYTLEENHWNGITSLQLNLKDLRNK